MRIAFTVLLALAIGMAPATFGAACQQDTGVAAQMAPAESCCCGDLTGCRCCPDRDEHSGGEEASAGSGCACAVEAPQSHESPRDESRTESVRSASVEAAAQDEGPQQRKLFHAVETPRVSAQPEVRAPLLL